MYIALPIIANENGIKMQIVPNELFFESIANAHIIYATQFFDDFGTILLVHHRNLILVTQDERIRIHPDNQCFALFFCMTQKIQMSDMEHIVSALCIAEFTD